jgi:pimeloyl-ACP methyl ester carboxylesterase
MAVIPTFSALGTGATVLMLHDADGGRLTFAPQVETLAGSGYRAVAWDMPGYGHSAPMDSYTPKGLADACTALLDGLQAGPVTIVGHGMGAMVALEVAVRAPAWVQRLVLVAGGPPLDAAAQTVWVAPRLQALDAGHSMAEMAENIVREGCGERALPEGVRLARHALEQVPAPVYRRALQALPMFQRGAEHLAQVHVPALLVSGAQDRCTPPEALQALAHVLPDARYLELPGVGHWPQLEDPEAFDGALLDFLVQRRRAH